jgi:hypothetical protein
LKQEDRGNIEIEDIKNIEDIFGKKNAVPIELSFFGSYKLKLFCSGQVLSGLIRSALFDSKINGLPERIF